MLTARVVTEQSHWLFGRFFTCQSWSLQGSVLTIQTEAQEVFKYRVSRGRAWPALQFGIQVQTEDGRCLNASLGSKVKWATWLDAFQNLTPLPKSHSPIKVKFSDDIGIHEIPMLTDEEKALLFFPEPELARPTMCA
ncbi:unnamed protein product [Aphanomyces euteiches]|uniref:Uncharacterized protein n=1 Tax=Aphanomyces euteiches TaxID=100861 RepID=A0A6G0WN65_9STRA|nr:hypothetical protein Ae201684_013502 [Aphanomyces euteiches]KAH9062913.1 hypothetical protein Ae201684P_009179 [Aphanomyces euteiches]KAH9123047.1 hypothetical protein AeMF1_005866 [Aphanomyces euteiches]KAH9145162.1 hypothetical protein AeRB84_010930 [Aphanomyces euteiches]KAH9159023.1 hypothetical protein LEN26_002570 [Aphanomyces euteiches]